MGANMSDYLENNLLDHTLGTAEFTMPADVYLALYTDDPTDADSGTEVADGSYARQLVTFDAAAAGATQNAAEIVFPQATGDWGTISHVGLHDHLSAGNLLLHGPLAVPKEILTDDQLKIADEELDAAFV